MKEVETIKEHYTSEGDIKIKISEERTVIQEDIKTYGELTSRCTAIDEEIAKLATEKEGIVAILKKVNVAEAMK